MTTRHRNRPSMIVHTQKDRMAVSEVFESLHTALQECDSVTELFKLAASDEFKEASSRLVPAELKTLRAEYMAIQVRLDGKVKLEEFDGQILQLTDISYWHSKQWSADGVTLTYTPESQLGKRFKSLTSSSIIVRFCNQLETPPTKAEPLRVLVALIPVDDAERAAKGQKKWTIKRLAPPQTRDGSESTPF